MIPMPRTPDAPKWSSSAPEELDDFLWSLEQMFELGGITDDKKKIRWAAMYPDKEDAADWKGFEEYGGSSWDEFKRVLLKEYRKERPLKRIRDLSREFKPIGIDNEEDLRVFVRRFRAAARKCMGERPLISDWEAIQLFQDTLTEEFQDRLRQQMIIAAQLTNVDLEEESLELETVLKIAVKIVIRRTAFLCKTREESETRIRGGDTSIGFLEFKEDINARLAAMEDRIANLEKGKESSVIV